MVGEAKVIFKSRADIKDIRDQLWRNREQVARQIFLIFQIVLHDQYNICPTTCIEQDRTLTINASSITKYISTINASSITKQTEYSCGAFMSEFIQVSLSY